MNLLWTFLTVMTVIALVISFFLKGKAMAARVREFLGTSKQRAVKFMSEFKRKTFQLVGLLVPGIYYFGLKFGFLTKFQACSIVAGFAGFSLTVDVSVVVCLDDYFKMDKFSKFNDDDDNRYRKITTP